MSLPHYESQTLNEQSNQECSLCHKPPDKNVVTCVDCHKIFHKNCVNVADNNITFKCPQCFTVRSTSPAPSTSSHCSNRSHASQSRKLDLKLQKLEEERKLNKKYLDDKYKLLEEAEDLTDISDDISQSGRDWLVLNESPNNTEQPTVSNVNHPTNLQTPNLSNQTDNKNSSSMPSNFVPKTSQSTLICNGLNTMPQNSVGFVPPTVTSAAINSSSTMVAVPNCTTTISTHSGYQQRTQPTVPPVYTYPVSSVFSSHYTNNNAQNLFNSIPQQFIESHPTPSTLHFPQHGQTMAAPCPPTHLTSAPTVLQNQINSRQSLPKELPEFSGHPEDWPVFISTYEWSTTACAFTDAENLIRLQKALKGEALHSVQQMLIHPSNVSIVLQVLRILYGQPEKIINSIKNRINSFPKVEENNLKTLTSLSIEVRSLISTITASDMLDELNNSSLLFDIMQKLPPSYQMQWASQKIQLINQNKKPNLFEFDKWFFNVGITASSIILDQHTNKWNKEKTINKSNATITNKRAFIHSHSERKCIVCNNNNSCSAVANCPTYLSMDRGEKWNAVRKYKLCKFCLSKHSGDCNKKKKCGKEGCEYFHHPSLHRYSTPLNKTKETSIESKSENNNLSNKAVNNSHSGEIKNVLFKIIPIKIFGNNNKTVNTFAFIDEGSSISLMDESLANELEIDGVPNPLCLRWTGGMERSEQNSKKLRINISGGNKKHVSIDVSTVKSLNLPVQSLDYKTLSERYRHLRNLPIESYSDAVPQILIGLNHFDLGVSNKIREGSPQEPVAVCTKLGWFIYGAVAANKTASTNYNFHVCDCSARVNELDELVRSFYSLDSVGVSVKNPLIAESEARALDLLEKYTKYKPCGHYEVPLLWKFDLVEMPDSYQMALKRLVCLEKKLRQNSELLNVFRQTISKYLEKKHIRKLDSHEIKRSDGKIWYLPIFAVFNKNKPNKTRIVWDAAATSNGMSLNSYLLKGPDYLASLPSILFKFRQKSVAVCGDIEEMFHQVHIRPEDCDVQRFLWRDCMDEKPPDVFVMNVMIFGATCAPSISQYIKNLNASKFQNEFPLAAKAIKENHYVDDLLISVDNPKEAIQIVTDITYVHRKAGFNIRNWISNDKSVLKSICSKSISDSKCLNSKDEKQIEKVLGIFWEHQEDAITFKISPWLRECNIFSVQKIPTKREMLRLVMSIYDPLGLIGHIVMYVKILMQDVWRSKIDWDERIPPELTNKWTKWINILPEIENIKIPRCYLKYFENYHNIEVHLHTFVDASKDGYAAVCYFRLRRGDDIICSLIGAKTRVAPLKITSVPRLELMAALIGARFAKYVSDNHDIKINEKYFWTDSKTVLSWLNSDHRKYNQFVAFRITEILELSSIKDWRWIASKQNVADEATKWFKIPKVTNSSRWFEGPEFLRLPENKWPQGAPTSASTEEERVHHAFNMTKFEPIFDIRRFSKWNRLVRAVAYVLRFVHNCRLIKKQNGQLTQEELQSAENILYKQAQREKYSSEISLLNSNLVIHKSSDIYNKTPYLQDGILRVHGRIDKADIPFDQKRPIILPRKSQITKLILMHYHCNYHHMNHETVINEVRQKFNISRLRATYKSVVRSCQMCKIKKAVPHNPQMAALPFARVASNVAPFTYTGIDFFGPITVVVNRHKEKRYGCLFTCLTIRAVHIEVAHSLTTSSCILAIRNFMARRGIPHEFYSDNGTNFVGAERELRIALADVDKDELVKSFTTTTTKWKFNPPASPHMGGAWERLVRSIKTILYQIMPSRSPSDELLQSMLLEVENVINSRPLTYVPVDAESGEALTPNHFLVGSSSGLKPMTTCDDSGILLKQRWLASQQYANIFWKRWLNQYLPSLTCRSKWHGRPKPLCQGDLVVIVDPTVPRNVWLRGKVLEVRLASDGQVRSAKVLTQHGVLERPAAKLAILEVAHQEESGGEEASCHTAGGMLTPLPKTLTLVDRSGNA